MIEQRVAKLEEDMKDIKSTLKSIEASVGSLKESVARMDGKLSQSPTALQLIGLTLTTWAAGAAIVFTMMRAIGPVAK